MRVTSVTVLATTKINSVLDNCEVHQQQHFERHPTVEDCTDMNQDTC